MESAARKGKSDKKNAEWENGNPTKTAGSSSDSASVLKVTQNRLIKNKLAESPVLQPAPTEDKQSAVRTLSNFMKNISQLSENASDMDNDLQFSIMPEEDVRYALTDYSEDEQNDYTVNSHIFPL